MDKRLILRFLNEQKLLLRESLVKCQVKSREKILKQLRQYGDKEKTVIEIIW